MIKILLGRDEVTPDKPDKSGFTPLESAAQMGHYGVVKTLLERNDVNTNKPTSYGETPLTLAARSVATDGPI